MNFKLVVTCCMIFTITCLVGIEIKDMGMKNKEKRGCLNFMLNENYCVQASSTRNIVNIESKEFLQKDIFEVISLNDKTRNLLQDVLEKSKQKVNAKTEYTEEEINMIIRIKAMIDSNEKYVYFAEFNIHNNS